MKNRFSAKPAKIKNPALQRILDGLKIVQAILLIEKQKPDPEKSRLLVFAAQETADVLIRRLEELKR